MAFLWVAGLAGAALPAAPPGADGRFRAGQQPELAVGHDRLARLHGVEHHDVIAVGHAGMDRADVGGAIRQEDEDLAARLAGDDGGRRHDEGAGEFAEPEGDIDKLARQSAASPFSKVARKAMLPVFSPTVLSR